MDKLPKYKLTDDEQKFFNALKYEFTLSDGKTWVNPKAKQEWEMLQGLLSNIGDVRGRKYALAKMLPQTNYFKDETKFPNATKEAWSPTNLENYVPPDIEKAQAKIDEKNFWDLKSDKHWTKLDSKDIERRAKNAGYGDTKAYLEDVAKYQTYKDRNDRFNEEFGLLSPIVRLAYPRSSEAVLEGRDIEGKDLGLDLFEQGMYSLDPVGRTVGGIKIGTKVGAKGAETLLGKAVKEAPSVAGALANPAIMELGDAVAYANDDGSHRQNANIGDVLIGGGINYGMGKMLRGLIGEPQLKGELQTKVDKADELISRGIDITRQKADDAMLAYGKHSPQYAEAQKNLQYMLGKKKTMEKQKAKIKKELGNQDKYPLKNQAKYAIQQDVPTLITNELGDAVSDDPKMTKRVIRYGARVPFIGGMFGPMIDAYYNAKNEQDARKKVDELIYGLQDWRNE